MLVILGPVAVGGIVTDGVGFWSRKDGGAAAPGGGRDPGGGGGGAVDKEGGGGAGGITVTDVPLGAGAGAGVAACTIDVNERATAINSNINIGILSREDSVIGLIIRVDDVPFVLSRSGIVENDKRERRDGNIHG